VSKRIPETQLILNKDGSIYHLNLLPEDIADTIILVGDPNRVPNISAHFDEVELTKSNREIVTHTGYLNKKRLTVISTGMGASSVEIVLNELDALANIDLPTRTVKETLTSLTLVRLGTCGGLQPETAVDSCIVSQYGFAFDGIMGFYQALLSQEVNELQAQVRTTFAALPAATNAYAGVATTSLVDRFSTIAKPGITMTCSGFYGPQNRQLRLAPAERDVFELANQIQFGGLMVENLEMETAMIYALANQMGHQCCSVSTVLGNRVTEAFTKDGAKSVNNMITSALPIIATLSM